MRIEGVSEDIFVLTDDCFTESQVLGTTTNIGPAGCALSCHIRTDCALFEYNQESTTCRLVQNLREPNDTTCLAGDAMFVSIAGEWFCSSHWDVIYYVPVVVKDRVIELLAEFC